MDPLDHLFASMRVADALHARLQARGPWGIRFLPGRNARFGFVLDGECWLERSGREVVKLRAGCCYVLMHGDSYSLTHEPGAPTMDCRDAIGRLAGGIVELGDRQGTPATVVTGWFTLDERAAVPLLQLLPTLLLTTIGEERSPMLESLLQLLALETEQRRPGGGVMVSRLADLLFIHAIRQHAASTSAQSGGWLRALSDRYLGPSLKALHASPSRQWKVGDLAAEAGLSRSAFAERFTTQVGEPPLHYLRRWRMHLACEALREGALPLKQVAEDCGYESVAAFTKAFTRLLGISPGAFRTNARIPSAAW